MLIITGLAGAGKTIALDTLEDLGYYCIDNLPSALLASLVRDFAPKQAQPVAVAMDSRNAVDLAAPPEKIRELRQQAEIQILFLTADTDVLVRRYSETRRPHPLHIRAESARALPEAIEYERHLLNPLMNLADIILDTSGYSVYQLKDRLRTVLGDAAPALIITLQSFGFKHGTPVNADFLFDVRFLPNPFYDPAMRALTGNDDPHWTSAAAAVARRHHIPYLMTWANFEQEEKNFYQPFMVSDTRGHELVDGFIDYYNEETSLFADGLGDWRGLPVPVQE